MTSDFGPYTERLRQRRLAREARGTSPVRGSVPTSTEGASDFGVPMLPQDQQPEPGLTDRVPEPIRQVGRDVSRLASLVDTPLSERAGLHIEGLGPLDNVANFVLEEATRPTNVLFAAGGLGAAARLGRSSSRLLRGAGRLIEPVTPGADLPTRFAAETGLATGARIGIAGADALIPEDAPLALQLTGGIAGGLIGGLGAVGAMARIAPKAFVRPNIEPLPDGTVLHHAPEGAAELFDMQPIVGGLSLRDEARNAFVRTAGRHLGMKEIDEIAKPAMEARKRGLRSTENAATRVATSEWSNLSRVFKFDEDEFDHVGRRIRHGTYRIKALANERFPEGPTLSDLAARLPEFLEHLSPEQRAAMERLRDVLAPFRKLFEEVGGDTATRGDIMEGGFYIPRGDALLEGMADAPIIRQAGRTAKAGYQKTMQWKSQAEGIANGEEYVRPAQALHSYVQAIGRDTVNMWVGSYFLNAVDPVTGRKIIETAADRIPKGLQKQVKSLRSRIRTRRDAVVRDLTRLAERAAERTRAESRVGAQADRVARSIGRQADAPTEQEMSAIRETVRGSIQDGRNAVAAITDNAAKLRQANVTLNATERELVKKAEALARLLDEAEALTTAERARGEAAVRRTFEGTAQIFAGHDEAFLARQVRPELQHAHQLRAESRKMFDVVRRMDDEVMDLTDRAVRMSERVDDLMSKGRMYAQLDDGVRGELSQAIRTERLLAHQDLQSSVLRRELHQLELEQNRLIREARSAGEREGTAAARAAKSSEMLEELRGKLDEISGSWKAAKERAGETPIGQARLHFPGLQHVSAPETLARTVNSTIEQEMKAQGRQSAFINGLIAFNNLYRGLRATLDMSGPGIQGIVGMTNDPRAYGTAFVTSWKAWADNGERLLGNFINDFDGMAREVGRADSQMWGAANLRLGGAMTEFAIGTGLEDLAGSVLRTTPWKQANKAFGYFGDTLRLNWADSMLQGEIARGRTLEQIIESGDLRRIASAANSMTGWSPERFAGNWGDLLLFAPRFLQARLETMGRALMGVGPNPSMDQRMALQSIMRMISVGTGLTFFMHYMFNAEDSPWPPTPEKIAAAMPDINPLKDDGTWNPNFMRIRAAGRDWSFFGTWDSLLRATVLTASGKPHDALRGMSSGAVANTWNLLTGTTLVGERRFRDAESTLSGIAENITPFALTDAATNVMATAQGDITGATGLIGDIFGVKSAPTTPWENRDIAARRTFGKDWVDLSGTERERLEAENPDIVSAIEDRLEERAKAGDQNAGIQMRRKEIDRQRVENELHALSLFLQGEYSARDLSNAISSLARDAAIQKKVLDSLVDEFEPNSPQAIVLSAYFDTFRLAEDAAGQIDWEVRDSLERDLLDRIAKGEFGDPDQMRRFIDERRTAEHPEELQWFFDHRELIMESGYYEQQDKAFDRFRRLALNASRGEAESYSQLLKALNRAHREQDHVAILRLERVKRQIDQRTQQLRRTLRRRNADLDVALLQTGRVTRLETAKARRLSKQNPFF